MKTKFTSMKTRLTTLHNETRTCEKTEPVPRSKPVLALLMRLLWSAALVLPAFGASAGVVFTNLHSFQVSPMGANPQAGLVQGSDGNFYGTTYNGGTTGGNGTVFKISANGALTSLYSFTGGNNPQAGLVQGRDGYFYGTTYSGGTNNSGTVFKISTNGALTSLYSFTGGNDGYGPNGLVEGSDGNFYGTTELGGTNSNGTVFKISTNGALTSLYSFTGTNDGGSPAAALVQGSGGYFYGTTFFGGTNNDGTVFKISTNGALTSLYSFTADNDGANPNAAMVQGSDGYFYGTALNGGTNSAGTVFKISTNGALTSLYSFTGGNDGSFPNGLVRGADGNLYGTTGGGGTNLFFGTVFKINTNGALTSLYSFTGGNDGSGPNGLVRGTDGSFYGTTYGGGTNTLGTVFQISTNGALTRLYSFTGTNDGSGPNGLVQGSDGNFYGTTVNGGMNLYFGTVFKISTSGALTSLYSFTAGNGNDGAYPQAGLVQGSDGYFYGTTAYGGTNGYGTVFKISTNGAFNTLYSFNGTNDGTFPNGLVQGSDGYFYGTTSEGGTNGYGTVFKISTNGTLTRLHSFTGGNDGADPFAGLVQGSDGYFYGTTSQNGGSDGTVFRISTNGAFNTLHSFNGTNDGTFPNGLVQGGDGYFYGTTSGGGPNGYGTVFKISTNGALTTLYSFTGGNGGGNPGAGLVQGSDGSFYGAASGGAGGAGTVFRLTILPPQLTITVSGANVILSWPTNYTGFFLQHTLYLGAAAGWVSVTVIEPPVIVNGQFVVTLPNAVTGTQQFYRLSQ